MSERVGKHHMYFVFCFYLIHFNLTVFELKFL